ncbi:MAG TPA: rRNA maturation RNase YbeY [Chthoniobacterales bacterium]
MITVQNRQRKISLNLAALRAFSQEALTAVLAEPPQRGDVLAVLDEIGVTIVSDAKMAKLHVDFMGIPGPTDVLTFEHGEIVVSAETAARYGAEHSQTPNDEVSLYILHGLLHLRGFDDLEPAAAEKMRTVQARLFEPLRK